MRNVPPPLAILFAIICAPPCELGLDHTQLLAHSVRCLGLLKPNPANQVSWVPGGLGHNDPPGTGEKGQNSVRPVQPYAELKKEWLSGLSPHSSAQSPSSTSMPNSKAVHGAFPVKNTRLRKLKSCNSCIYLSSNTTVDLRITICRTSVHDHVQELLKIVADASGQYKDS